VASLVVLYRGGCNHSGQQRLVNLGLTLYSDQALLQALVEVRQLPGVEAQQVKDKGLEVAEVNRVFGHKEKS